MSDTPLTHIFPCTQNQSLTNSHRTSDMTWNTLTPLLFVNPHIFHYSLYADLQFMFRKHICLLPRLEPCNSLYPFRDFMNIGMQYDLYQELADLGSHVIIYTIICLKSVCLSGHVRRMQFAILDQSSREMSQTDRIHPRYFLSRVRV